MYYETLSEDFCIMDVYLEPDRWSHTTYATIPGAWVVVLENSNGVIVHNAIGYPGQFKNHKEAMEEARRIYA